MSCPGPVAGGGKQQRMARSQRGDIAVVTTADDTGQRNLALTHHLDHGSVASIQAGITEQEMPQAVVTMHIDARVVEHQLGLETIEQVGHVGVQRLQIGAVSGFARQPDVAIRRCLAAWKVLGAMHRNGECVAVVVQ